MSPTPDTDLPADDDARPRRPRFGRASLTALLAIGAVLLSGLCGYVGYLYGVRETTKDMALLVSVGVQRSLEGTMRSHAQTITLARQFAGVARALQAQCEDTDATAQAACRDRIKAALTEAKAAADADPMVIEARNDADRVQMTDIERRAVECISPANQMKANAWTMAHARLPVIAGCIRRTLDEAEGKK